MRSTIIDIDFLTLTLILYAYAPLYSLILYSVSF